MLSIDEFPVFLKKFVESNSVEIAGALHSLDEFLDVSLFLAVIGLGIAVAAFTLPVSENYLIYANRIGRSVDETKDAELSNKHAAALNISTDMKNASNSFLSSIYPAFMGLLLLLPFDGFFDGDETDELKKMIQGSPDFEIFSMDLTDESLEALLCILLLGLSFWKMKGGVLSLRKMSALEIETSDQSNT